MSASADVKEVEEMMQILGEMNLYFLGGVKSHIGKERAKDEDIAVKNYVYFDFDLRKAHPQMTDEQIKDTWKWLDQMIKDDELLGDWRYIVFTGNGLHVYYFFDPVLVKDKDAWRAGVTTLIERMEKAADEPIDHACCNVARIARLPGSKNYKSTQPKAVEIVAFNDRMSKLGTVIEALGRERKVKEEIEREQSSIQAKQAFPEDDTFKAIQNFPIDRVVVKLFGWTFDGKHFYAPGSSSKSACFVPKGENFLVHGGTSHIPATQTGFRPFDLVRTVKNFDNNETFRWFTANFPEIAAAWRKYAAQREMRIAAQNIATGGIGDIFSELSDVNFEMLRLGPSFDKHKFIIRGAVTRIGAYSNIGKSKLAYFFAYTLLQNGYRGIIVSTEVPRSIVLANLITITSGAHFWDIVEKRYTPTEKDRAAYKNLEIYDVTHTQNNLASVEAIISRSKGMGKLDFVIIDFCQGMMPAQKAQGEYELMSKYALEVQAMAQKYEVSIIDLSQISNQGVKDEFARVGMIPYKGSGHLYSSADIGVLLKRENKFDEGDNSMQFDIRKHKYLPPVCVDLVCDFKNGKFKVFGSEFDDSAPIISQALRLGEGGGEF